MGDFILVSLPRGVRDRSAARLLFGDATALPRVDALENSDAVDEDAGILLFDSALFNFAASILALGGRVRTWSALDRLAGGRFLVFLAGDGGAELCTDTSRSIEGLRCTKGENKIAARGGCCNW